MYLCFMSIYQRIKSADERTVNELLKLGFLKSTFKRNVAIYEAYLQYRQRGEPSTDAVVHTADDFGISDRHVFTIVRRFSEDPTVT